MFFPLTRVPGFLFYFSVYLAQAMVVNRYVMPLPHKHVSTITVLSPQPVIYTSPPLISQWPDMQHMSIAILEWCWLINCTFWFILLWFHCSILNISSFFLSNTFHSVGFNRERDVRIKYWFTHQEWFFKLSLAIQQKPAGHPDLWEIRSLPYWPTDLLWLT